MKTKLFFGIMIPLLIVMTVLALVTGKLGFPAMIGGEPTYSTAIRSAQPSVQSVTLENGLMTIVYQMPTVQSEILPTIYGIFRAAAAASEGLDVQNVMVRATNATETQGFASVPIAALRSWANGDIEDIAFVTQWDTGSSD